MDFCRQPQALRLAQSFDKASTYPSALPHNLIYALNSQYLGKPTSRTPVILPLTCHMLYNSAQEPLPHIPLGIVYGPIKSLKKLLSFCLW
jgi:hypothetical protein